MFMLFLILIVSGPIAKISDNKESIYWHFFKKLLSSLEINKKLSLKLVTNNPTMPGLIQNCISVKQNVEQSTKKAGSFVIV